jgi:hypothetical protein
VARCGGDGFAILLEDDAYGGGLAARMLDEVLNTPVMIADREVSVDASSGVATLLSGEPTIDSRELIRRADIARYSARRNGKGTAVPYVHVARCRGFQGYLLARPELIPAAEPLRPVATVTPSPADHGSALVGPHRLTPALSAGETLGG